jgi:hypothetical protein
VLLTSRVDPLRGKVTVSLELLIFKAFPSSLSATIRLLWHCRPTEICRNAPQAFEPVEQFGVDPHSFPNSFYLDFADDLYRSPLFAALRLPRPGE